MPASILAASKTIPSSITLLDAAGLISPITLLYLCHTQLLDNAIYCYGGAARINYDAGERSFPAVDVS